MTLIDPVFYNGILSSRPASRDANADDRALDFYFSQAASEGPPGKIALLDSSPSISEMPFTFIWDNCEFRCKQSGFYFVFKNQEAGIDFSGFCPINKPPDIIYPIKGHSRQSKGMSYITKTRMHLTGKFKGEPITGQAWLDHQWGDYNWLFDQQEHRIIKGWNWYGINLDDGSDLLVLRQFEAETKLLTDGFAVLFRDGKISRANVVELEILSEWFSHKTDASFPVSMKIEVPEMNADLVFTPITEDQEIPVFGPMRSVWQGTGRVRGRLKGVEVSGSARCELAGYSYIHNLKDHFNRLSSRIDRSIESFFPKKPDSDILRTYLGPPYWTHEPYVMEEMISKPVWDLMSRPGKRWRPLFSYYLLKTLDIDPRPYEKAVFALAELIHTGSLIIDDIQDGSPTRRGDESIHLRYGQDLAITAGNTLYFLPSILIMDHPDLNREQKNEILQLMNRFLIKAHFGQLMDLYWSKQYVSKGLDPFEDPVILDRILQAYSLKTGSPVQGLAEATAVIAKATSKMRDQCGEFAKSVGIAFQIIDDIRNFSDDGKSGKIPGEDLKEGKITFAIAHCIKQVSAADRNFLIDLIQSPDQRRDPYKFEKGLEIVRNSGVLNFCREKAAAMVDESWDKFSASLSPSDSKVLLRLLCYNLVNASV